MIRVMLPEPLRVLAQVPGEVALEVASPATQEALLDAIEARYPVLRGRIRDEATNRRRPFLRFFAGQEDLSHLPPDAPLPAGVAAGSELFYVVGAMAGG